MGNFEIKIIITKPIQSISFIMFWSYYTGPGFRHTLLLPHTTKPTAF